MKNESKAHLFLVISGVLFGANYWVTKNLMSAFSAEEILFFRIIVVTALLWITGSLTTETNNISRKDMFILFIAGVLGVFLNQYLFLIGLEYSTVIETSILHTLAPILIAFLSILFLHEKINLQKSAGILSGFAGAVIIVSTGKTFDFSDLHFKGNLFILLNIFIYSLHLIILKPVLKKYNTIQVLKYIFLFGLISYAPFGYFTMKSASFSDITIIQWGALAYIVFVATFFAKFLSTYALKILPAFVVGFYIYLNPFVTTLIGYITSKEQLNLPKIISAVFLFIGIWLILKNQKFEK